ncbi:MarR family transcriptional regulator [Mesorhizobium sp. M8A.F.Ca.ET.208.01.1.1]|uniref:MarR family winged helix-turn-helix transcriptional regulator n=1 Tax=unclassified Mesorhizobium TaxID=325217 RepID=UPI001093AB6D|nr:MULTISPECIES: MarR family transcriptional regulator [unclassified Mesorhizobium]TGQ89064.1 MarR family transcriptional regulator [Mesorhizobium sp. M8A.F.Ca.ET.208.01.1.1]TGR32169.1 MarR family transcriptional regulator [Mesorhizobium sp. M8A.F.Ca.ET.202.01.1.1]TGT50384.1 MarR family transcriptional regulator [Mesorhizobium sp. M8A.F.Ca.ET.167.01.1.1]TGU40047.1 MarR family transcriptional regulator [bacterium M00.F.Ca.ET.156.01.1.1]
MTNSRHTHALQQGSAGPSDRRSERFVPAATVSHPDLLRDGSDYEFRDTIHLMTLAIGRLLICRDAFGRRANLTGSQFAVLLGTAYCEGCDGVTIRKLSEHVHLAQTHVTTEVGRLVRIGLLKKKPSSNDRRSVQVSLSDSGRDAVARLTPFIRTANDLLFAGVTRSEIDSVRNFFAKVVSNSEGAIFFVKKRPEGTFPSLVLAPT